MSAILEYIINFFSTSSDVQGLRPSNARHFVPEKKLREGDAMIVAMLNSNGHEDTCYCVCDPYQSDIPIIFASDGFCKFTGYSNDEIEGRNCRFLQGKSTKESDISIIRKAIKDEEQRSVNLLNYRKDGSTFINEFFISPLYSYENGRKVLSYFIGIQCPVSHAGPGQAPKNPGWVYTHGSHNDDEQKMNDDNEIHYKAGMKIVSSFNDLKNSVDTQ